MSFRFYNLLFYLIIFRFYKYISPEKIDSSSVMDLSSLRTLMSKNKEGKDFCTGILINPTWVLTTFYCALDLYPDDLYYLYFGNETVCVETTMKSFSRTEYEIGVNGIAMIQINTEIKPESQYLEIGTDEMHPFFASECKIVLWERTDYGKSEKCGFPYVSAEWKVEIKHFSDCEKVGYTTIRNSKLCIFNPKDSPGDYLPGGLLICDGKMYGVTDTFPEKEPLYLVASNLIYFLDWIFKFQEKDEELFKSVNNHAANCACNKLNSLIFIIFFYI